MPSNARSAQPLRSTLGIACLGVGTVGLVLPLIPGIPLLIAGAMLLRGRARRNPEPLLATDRGLSRTEHARVKLLLMARRMTTAAESMRLARARRRRYR